MTVFVLAFYPHGKQKMEGDCKLVRNRKLDLRILHITKSESGEINMQSEDQNYKLLGMLKKETSKLVRVATQPGLAMRHQCSQDSVTWQQAEDDRPTYSVKYCS